jgi:ribonuclease PH
MIAAVGAAFLESTPLLDPNHQESSATGPKVSLAMHVNLGQAVILVEHDAIAMESFEAVTELAGEGCKAVARFMRDKLLQNVQTIATVRGAGALY